MSDPGSDVRDGIACAIRSDDFHKNVLIAAGFERLKSVGNQSQEGSGSGEKNSRPAFGCDVVS